MGKKWGAEVGTSNQQREAEADTWRTAEPGAQGPEWNPHTLDASFVLHFPGLGFKPKALSVQGKQRTVFPALKGCLDHQV